MLEFPDVVRGTYAHILEHDSLIQFQSYFDTLVQDANRVNTISLSTANALFDIALIISFFRKSFCWVRSYSSLSRERPRTFHLWDLVSHSRASRWILMHCILFNRFDLLRGVINLASVLSGVRLRYRLKNAAKCLIPFDWINSVSSLQRDNTTQKIFVTNRPDGKSLVILGNCLWNQQPHVSTAYMLNSFSEHWVVVKHGNLSRKEHELFSFLCFNDPRTMHLCLPLAAAIDPHVGQRAYVFPIGRDLMSLLEVHDSFSMPLFRSRWTKAVVRDVLSALDFLHASCHQAHMDLSPENVILNAHKSSGTYQLIDFGCLTPIFEPFPSCARHGKKGFMAPERFTVPNNSVSPVACDLYAVGAIAWTVLTNSMPYAEGMPSKVIESALLSEEETAFLKKAMHLVPAERGTAQALLRHPWLKAQATQK